MKNKIFFSVADRQLEPYITFDKFEKSLFANILFDEGIVIPDIFIFVSKHIEDHITRSISKSFFESALEKGYIIPSFRDPQKFDFLDALNVVRGGNNPNAAILGIQENADLIAQRLQLCAQSKDYKHEIWSTEINFGEQYEKAMVNFLMKDEMISLTNGDAFDKEEMRELWNLTHEWRFEVIGEAIEQTKIVAGTGLRRSEIHNAVARKLGLPITKEVGDVRYLLSAVENNKPLFHLLRVFMEWVTECYHFNMSSCLECIPNFPNFDSRNGLILASLLPERKALSSSNLTYIEEEVKFPSLSMLRRVRGNDLISVRNDYGHGFFAAKKAWQDNPSTKNEEYLRRILREYTTELNNFIGKHYGIEGFSPANFIFGKGTPQDRKSLDEIFGLVKSGLSLIAGIRFDVVISFGKSLFTVLGFWNKEPETQNVRIFTDKIVAEVNVPDSPQVTQSK